MDNSKITPEFMKSMAELVESITGDRNETGFALFIMPTGTKEEGQRIHYVSNVERVDFMANMNAWIKEQNKRAN